MKKLIYLCFAMCFFTLVSTAQKFTQQDLQGTWKLTSFSGGGMTIDVVKGKFDLSPELLSQLSESDKMQMDLGMAQAMEMFKESYAEFTGNSLKQNMGPAEHSGTFTLKEEGGKQFLVFTDTAGVTEDLGVSIKDKSLHLLQGTGAETAELVFIKQP